MKSFLKFIIAYLFLCLTSAVMAQELDTTSKSEAILVLDGSGSMWGQIDGESKIAIAKTVLADLLGDLPAGHRLGLIAYGHRRDGDCDDIEELAPVGTDRKAIASAVQGISPKGKTPMADAINLAAEKLKYAERKATVILVSDGVETCVPDPCAVAAALEKNGVDFTAHVIGFDVTEENNVAQLRCIAENTGGKFVSAANSGELGKALQETVTAKAESILVTRVKLQATELEGGLVIDNGLAWSVVPADGGDAVISQENAGTVEAEIKPGRYDVRVTRPADGLKGELKHVVITENTQKTLTIALNFPVVASVQPNPASGGVAGTNISVDWTGPNRQGDYIAIARQKSDDQTSLRYQYTARGNPLELRLPLEAGNYIVRYMLGRPIRELASAAITVTPAEATLSAPAEAIAGEETNVDFTGPPAGSGDWVTVTLPKADDQVYTSYYYTKQGSPATIRMPFEPGDYELRFVQNDRKVLARRPIRVVTALASVRGPESAISGEEILVEFTGPKPASEDWITVVAPEASPNRYTDYHYTQRGSPAKIRMPLEAGNYELRFVQGGKKVLARQAITVTPAPR